MWYTESEIIKAYKNASNRSEIVDILCDINQCDPSVIYKILFDNNLISTNTLNKPKEEVAINNLNHDDKILKTNSNDSSNSKRPRFNWTTSNKLKLFELWHQRMSNIAISKELGASPGAVVNAKHRFQSEFSKFEFNKYDDVNEIDNCSKSPVVENSLGIDVNIIKQVDRIQSNIDNLIAKLSKDQYSSFELGLDMSELKHLIIELRGKITNG